MTGTKNSRYKKKKLKFGWWYYHCSSFIQLKIVKYISRKEKKLEEWFNQSINYLKLLLIYNFIK